MVSGFAQDDWRATGWETIAALARADGSAAHPIIARLTTITAPQRDLADAIHAICAVHGTHPGLIDAARARDVQPDATDWLEESAAAFAAERAYLAQLTAAAGPLPSTPGQAETEAAVAGQRHAFEMLARSDRVGCATGAVAALLLDWRGFRGILDIAADRFGVDRAVCALPDQRETGTVVASLDTSPAVERAMAFGAQQIFAQHRGMLDLLEARTSARDDL